MVIKMRKIIALFFAFTCLAVIVSETAYAASFDLSKGFRRFLWGGYINKLNEEVKSVPISKITSYVDIQPIIARDIEVFELNNDVKKIGQINVTQTYYVFYKKKFYQVVIIYPFDDN
jgi:hypothetical protein